MPKHSGDSSLSSHELHLWQLHQHILHQWGTYTIFRHTRMNVPQMKDQLIEWFVPGDSTFAYEIVEYVKQELADEIREASSDWPGANVIVSVEMFSGVEPYLNREQSKKIAKEATERFLSIVKEMQKKPKKPPEKETPP